jgi:hypothetical protein
MLKAHIEVDCVVIKYLSAFRSKCNNCFPAYYYFSPTTGACYNEFIDSVPLTKYVQRLNTSTEEGVESMKSLFLQVRVCTAVRVHSYVCPVCDHRRRRHRARRASTHWKS